MILRRIRLRSSGVERVVHASTSEVYGTAQQVPIDETHPLQGLSPYAASKIGADKLAENFYCAYDLPVVTVRPFNSYGPRQSVRALIPAINSQVLMGVGVKLGNLNARRDFIFVSDTVAGFLAAAEVSEIEGQTFNLGVGKEITVGELAEIIIDLIGEPA
jgi:dTDP-glucose 4,6-dehydratase